MQFPSCKANPMHAMNMEECKQNPNPYSKTSSSSCMHAMNMKADTNPLHF